MVRLYLTFRLQQYPHSGLKWCHHLNSWASLEMAAGVRIELCHTPKCLNKSVIQWAWSHSLTESGASWEVDSIVLGCSLQAGFEFLLLFLSHCTEGLLSLLFQPFLPLSILFLFLFQEFFVLGVLFCFRLLILVCVDCTQRLN